MKGLGQRIKTLRKMRDLTLTDVAKKTGIDQATLSRMENGLMVGTIHSHMRIANALGIPLPDLYKDTLDKLSETKEKSFTKKIETFSHAGGAVAELLTSGILQKKMMPVLLKIKPKGYTETEEYPRFTERFAYVMKGEIEIVVGKEQKTLKEGETFYFDAGQPHCFKNNSKTEAWCLSVMTPTSL
jgi:transcriptional regulator with XRE-family HTH domain